MSYINKFGESSIKHNLNNSKLRISQYNLEINNITKDIEKIYTTIKIIKDQFHDINMNLSNKVENRLNEIEAYIFKWISIEELKNEYDSQLNIIRSDIKILQENIKKNIDEDVALIEKAVKGQIYSSNKDFIKNIEERFNKIDDFIFKRIDKNTNVDDVKKRKLEWPKIKTAK